MTQDPIFLTVRRGLLAVFLVAGLCAAAPSTATAGPLCSEMGQLNFPIDDGSGEGSGGDGVICRDFILGVNNAAYYFFDFGDTSFEHLLRVTVDTVLESFGLIIQRIFHPDGTTFGFSGYTCLAYGRDGQCVEYQSLNNPVEGTDYSGDVTWLIAWTPSIGTVNGEIIHAPGTTGQYEILTENRFFNATLGPRDFDCDSPYTATCPVIEIGLKAPGDPVRAGTSDNFSSVVVIEPLVAPEPASLALLGIGLGGYLLRRRGR